MAGKLSFAIEKPISEMTTQDIRRWLCGLTDAAVLRSIIMVEIEAIRMGEPRERRTMRNMWYDQVKPVLSRAGLLQKKTSGGKLTDWDNLLSKYLAEFVRDGYTTYEELKIIDGSRQRQTAQTIEAHIIEPVQLVGPHFPWVILFTEKDTIWLEVQGLADLYGVSAISGGGEPSFACTENTIKTILRSEAFKDNQPEELILLSLTDYDPFGYTIAKSQLNQIIDVVTQIRGKERGNLRYVNPIRVGIYPSQLSPEEREKNAYIPSNEGLEKWYLETGGVDGQPLGLELDALPLSRLRQLFAEGIEEQIDLEKRYQDLRYAFIDLVACDLLKPDFDSTRQDMIEAVQKSDIWNDISNLSVEGVFMRAAIEGQDWIPPVQTIELYNDYKEKTEMIMQSFKE